MSWSRSWRTAGAIELVSEVPARGSVRHYYKPIPGLAELEMVRSTLESTDGQRRPGDGRGCPRRPAVDHEDVENV